MEIIELAGAISYVTFLGAEWPRLDAFLGIFLEVEARVLHRATHHFSCTRGPSKSTVLRYFEQCRSMIQALVHLLQHVNGHSALNWIFNDILTQTLTDTGLVLLSNLCSDDFFKCGLSCQRALYDMAVEYVYGVFEMILISGVLK